MDDFSDMIIPGIATGIIMIIVIFSLHGCAPSKQTIWVNLGDPCPDSVKCEVLP